MFDSLDSFSTARAGRAGAQLVTVIAALTLWFAHDLRFHPTTVHTAIEQSGAPSAPAVASLPGDGRAPVTSPH